MTWFNIFLYYNEERTCCHKLLSPLILLFYPFWIVPITLGLGLYGGLRVVSWYWDSWIQEISNPDCGFMAWICTKMNLPDCAPYQVVLLSAEESPNHPQHVWLETIDCFSFWVPNYYTNLLQTCSKGSKMHVIIISIFELKNWQYFAMISIFKQFRAKVEICIRFIKHEIWYKWPSLTFF